MREIARSIHQREMREGLWEIADQPARARFVLLAEQSNIITQRQKMVEQAQCFVAAAEHEIGIGEPEAAGKKDTLARRKTIGCGRAVVAQHQAVYQQAALDGRNGRNDPGIVRWKESDGRQQQQAGVQFLRTIGAYERTEIRIEASRADVGMNAVAYVAPFLNRP